MTNYLLINCRDKIEDVEHFYNRTKNFWKKAKSVKELSPIEEYIIAENRKREPIVSLDEQGKLVKLKNVHFIPVPF